MARLHLPAMVSSAADTWNTPPELISLLHAGWPAGVALDPCSNATSLVAARHSLTELDDGLQADWSQFVSPQELVYVNPPYGTALPSWAAAVDRQHLAMASAKLAHCIVTLVPARTDTRWWRVLVAASSSVIFLQGRVKFLQGPDGSSCGAAPFPSALVIHRHRTARAANKLQAEAARAGAWVVRQAGWVKRHEP